MQLVEVRLATGCSFHVMMKENDENTSLRSEFTKDVKDNTICILSTPNNQYTIWVESLRLYMNGRIKGDKLQRKVVDPLETFQMNGTGFASFKVILFTTHSNRGLW